MWCLAEFFLPHFSLLGIIFLYENYWVVFLDFNPANGMENGMAVSNTAEQATVC